MFTEDWDSIDWEVRTIYHSKYDVDASAVNVPSNCIGLDCNKCDAQGNSE